MHIYIHIYIYIYIYFFLYISFQSYASARPSPIPPLPRGALRAPVLVLGGSLQDGSVVTWGNPYQGADSSSVSEELRGILQILYHPWELFFVSVYIKTQEDIKNIIP